LLVESVYIFPLNYASVSLAATKFPVLISAVVLFIDSHCSSTGWKHACLKIGCVLWNPLYWESQMFPFLVAVILLPRMLLYTCFTDVVVSMEMLRRYLNKSELQDVG
jgi:flagellar biosynthesis protein FliP